MFVMACAMMRRVVSRGSDEVDMEKITSVPMIISKENGVLGRSRYFWIGIFAGIGVCLDLG